MDKHIIDGMKKEAKDGIVVMIFCYFLFVSSILSFFISDGFTAKEIILMSIFYFAGGSLGLYCFIYGMRYKLEITEEKVKLTTLFKKIEINIKDIAYYTYKRYSKKSVFYNFALYTKDKKIIVSTRYKDEFLQILKDSNIEMKIK